MNDIRSTQGRRFSAARGQTASEDGNKWKAMPFPNGATLLIPLRAGTGNLKVELQQAQRSARNWSSRFSVLPEQAVPSAWPHFPKPSFRVAWTSWYFVASHRAGIARNFFFVRSSQSSERLVVSRGWFRCANPTAGPSPDRQSQGTVLPLLIRPPNRESVATMRHKMLKT